MLKPSSCQHNQVIRMWFRPDYANYSKEIEIIPPPPDPPQNAKKLKRNYHKKCSTVVPDGRNCRHPPQKNPETLLALSKFTPKRTSTRWLALVNSRVKRGGIFLQNLQHIGATSFGQKKKKKKKKIPVDRGRAIASKTIFLHQNFYTAQREKTNRRKRDEER